MKPSFLLPSTYIITADGPVDATWWELFQRVLKRGHRLVQLRLKSLPESELRPIVARAAGLARASECKLLLNCSQERGSQERSSEEWVQEFGLAGLHLASARLMCLDARPLPGNLLVGASCHSIEELRQAEHIGADFACLSPVFSTQTHPRDRPMGLEEFGDLAKRCRLPVYALGGMGQGMSRADLDTEIEEVRRVGGQGIAGISAFWK